MPARDVYGLRVAKSEFGYRSLGAGSRRTSPGRSTAAPRSTSPATAGCRWTRPTCARWCSRRSRSRPRSTIRWCRRCAPKLFGAWEMNWLAYNDAHDVELPGSSGRAARLPDVSAGRDRQGPARQPRPGQLQVHDHGARAESLARRSKTIRGRAAKRPFLFSAVRDRLREELIAHPTQALTVPRLSRPACLTSNGGHRFKQGHRPFRAAQAARFFSLG